MYHGKGRKMKGMAKSGHSAKTRKRGKFKMKAMNKKR